MSQISKRVSKKPGSSRYVKAKKKAPQLLILKSKKAVRGAGILRRPLSKRMAKSRLLSQASKMGILKKQTLVEEKKEKTEVFNPPKKLCDCGKEAMPDSHQCHACAHRA